MPVSDKTRAKRHKALQGVDAYAFPDFEKLVKGHKLYNSEIQNAYNYANYVFELEELKGFVKEYVQANLKKVSIGLVPAWELAHLGKRAWIINKGGFIDKESTKELDSRLIALVAQYKPKKEEVVVSLETARTRKVIAELEGILDDITLKVKGIVQPLKIMEAIGKFDVEFVEKHFQAQIDWLITASEAEGVKATDKKRALAGLAVIMNDLTAYGAKKVTAPKKVRKARVRKIVPSKMVKKLKFLKENPELKLKSIHAEKIVGASALWVFNTKTRKLAQYVAADAKGLMVKGSTITNFDGDKSISKTIRKVEDTLLNLGKASKVEQRTLLSNIKAVGNKLNGRVNKDCILVKVY